MAKATTTGPWTCVGDQLSIEDARGEWTSVTVAGADTSVEYGGEGDVTMLDHDYDYWCETRAACTRYISSYIAEIKGNATYGYGSQTWGKFDVIWRQSFNGKYNRYRITLIWDSGSAVDSDWWRAQVRREVDIWADPVLGVAIFSPATVSSASWRAVKPSATTYTQVSKPIDQTSARYHDDLYGFFFARGYRFAAGTLHLPDFNYRYPSLRYPGA